MKRVQIGNSCVGTECNGSKKEYATEAAISWWNGVVKEEQQRGRKKRHG